MKKVFRVEGMTCNSCASLIESKLKDKVNFVSASYSKGEVEVDFDKNKISERSIIDLIEYDGEFVIKINEKRGVENEREEVEDKLGFWFMISSLLLLAYFSYNWISDLGLSIPGVGESSGIIILFSLNDCILYNASSMFASYLFRSVLNNISFIS